MERQRPKGASGSQEDAAPVQQVWDLLGLIDDADMTEKEKSAVLTLLAYLRRRMRSKLHHA